jgi:hypothetical protein
LRPNRDPCQKGLVGDFPQGIAANSSARFLNRELSKSRLIAEFLCRCEPDVCIIILGRDL